MTRLELLPPEGSRPQPNGQCIKQPEDVHPIQYHQLWGSAAGAQVVGS